MKIIIVGGVAGGATTATRLRRLNEQAEIIILERGYHISFANCGLPYYIGDVIEQKEELLLQTSQSFKERFNIEVRIRQEAIQINRDNNFHYRNASCLSCIRDSPLSHIQLPPVRDHLPEKL